MLKRLAKNTTVLSLGTLFCRILGLIRDILIATYFGTSKILEAFIVAFRIPNVFRSLLGEGFSDSVATPVLSEYHNQRERFLLLGRRLFSVSLVILGIVVILGILFSKYLVIVIAPGFLKDSYKLSLANIFTKITFFYLFFMGLVAVMCSFLYALKKFALPAFVPSLFSISLICGILFFRRYLHNYILVLSVLVAGLLQFLSLYLYLLSKKMRLTFEFRNSFKDKDIIRMFKLFVPRIWSSAVYHLNVFVDTIFASLSWIVGSGALAAIYYANRVIQFPLALIGVSIARVAMVDLSGFHKENNLEDFKKVLIFSFQNVLFFIIPITFLFLFMAKEIIKVVFVHGKFSTYSLFLTYPVLVSYSLGLFFFCGIKLLVNSFYSLKDTLTPAKTATFALIVNILLSAIFIFPLQVAGVALASSLAGIFNFFLLYRLLIKRIGSINWEGSLWEVVKLLILGVLTAGTTKVVWIILEYNKYIRIALSFFAGGIIFLLVGLLLKLRHFIYLKRWILRR